MEKHPFRKDRAALVETFARPGPEYRGKPFWSWNGELEGEELKRQARVMGEMGLGGFFMHARSGLITEYLGEDWFRLTNEVADEAEKLGLEAWLYDEDRWPSGSAGGKVTADPRYRMKSLRLTDTPAERFAWSPDIRWAFTGHSTGIEMADYAPLPLGTPVPREPGLRVYAFTVVPDPEDSVYNGATYLNTLSREATEKFIEVTHEAYRAHCGDRLGRSIRGIFTDEPHRGHGLDDLAEEDGVLTCSLCWTDDLFDEFAARYGYDIAARLPEVFYRLGGEKVSRPRIHYFDLADNLFLERFARPIHEWCQRNGMRFTGHVLHEDALSNQSVEHGSLMRFYAHMDDPGVDVLSGGDKNYWIVKQLASAARQLGKPWLLSELYGCTGWPMRLTDYKAVGDWQAFFGINLRCPHLSWYTMEGESKRDYPASILHQSPWYRDYEKLETYFARFGLVSSEGEPECPVLVVNPIESAWALAHAGWSQWLFATDPEVLALEAHYARLFHMLAGRQIDFDYGEEQMMAEDWGLERDARGPLLRIGLAKYRCAVVSGAVTLRPTTVAMLRQFLEAGGRVIFAGTLPGYVDGLPSDAVRALAALPGAAVIPFDADALRAAIGNACPLPATLTDGGGAPVPEVFCRVRRCENAGLTLVTLLNTDRERRFAGLRLSLPAYTGRQVQLWDMMTGERYDLGILGEALTLDFAPGQERVLALPEEAETLPSLSRTAYGEELALSGPATYALEEENVLVLDHAAWRWADGPWQETQEVLRTDRAVRDSLGLEHRSGSSLQPWFAKTFDTKNYGRLALSYRFTVDALPAEPPCLICERPESWTIALNGTPLTYRPEDGFWVDIAFKRLSLPEGLLRTGENEITLTGDFRRTTNIEALYLTGRFGVALAGAEARMTALPETLSPEDDLAAHALPFYSGAVTYCLPLPEAARRWKRLRVRLETMDAALVRLEDGGAILTPPYGVELPVPPDGVLRLTPVFTRRNTFGPLHRLPARTESVGPDSFTTQGDAWSEAYVLLPNRLGKVWVAAAEEK